MKHPPFERRYHGAMPNWVKIIGLRIRAVPECEGGGFAVAKEQASLIANSPETAADRDRLLAVNAELLAALKLARPWMPTESPGPLAQADLAVVDAAIAAAEAKP